jgi:hypothetical protein
MWVESVCFDKVPEDPMRKLILTSGAIVGILLAVSARVIFGHLGLDIVTGVGFAVFPLLARASSSPRADWARTALVIIGVLGLAKCLASWSIHARLLEPSLSAARAFGVVQTATGGFVLGLIAALALSGQLLGSTVGRRRSELQPGM